MGFNPFKAVTRAVGIHDKTANIIADVLPVTALFGAKPYGFDLYGAGSNLGRRLASLGQQQTPLHDTHDYQLQTIQPYTVGYPYTGGYSTWDYSMQSPVFSTPPVATPVQDYYLQQVPSSETFPPPGWFP